MNRSHLDDFAARHRLSADAVAVALELTGARPDAQTSAAFASRLARGAGIGATAAGVVFFVAANWQDMGLLGRFGLLEGALVACVALAFWRPPPALIGQSALMMATFLTGGLLALYGQTYQTGADTYELFFAWAALALLFALAGRSGPLWAVWWCVLNVGLVLACGWLGLDHLLWDWLWRGHLDRPTLLLIPCVINLLAAVLFLKLRATRFRQAAPLWLGRALAAVAVVYGTSAGIVAVTEPAWRRGGETAIQLGGAPALIAFAALCIGIGLSGSWRERDTLLLTLIAVSWIAISTAWLVIQLKFHSADDFLLVAGWIVAASAAAVTLLMHQLRQRRTA